jgi:hypothetical protein
MAKRPDGAAAPKPVVIILGEVEPDTLRVFGGSKSDRFNNALIKAAVDTGWFPASQSEEDRNRQIFVAVTGLQAFKPADEIEGMLAAQALAAHHAAMECARRAMLREQPFEAAQGFRKAAASASRTFVELLAALDRKRGTGGRQVVRVEHVNVHPGGQAIVGNIASPTLGRGGGATAEMRERPQAPGQLAYAPGLGAVLSPLLGTDAQRETVPSSSDAERPLPDARRQQHGTENA